MNENKNLPKDLPPMRHEFELDIIGKITNNRYHGKFSFQIPTAGKRARASIESATLNRGISTSSRDQMDQEVLEEGALFHKMFAFLKFSLVEFPEWWQSSNYGYDLYDPDPMIAVYKQCVDFEESWNRKVWGDGDKA